MGLSEQGYDPVGLGGCGHQESTAVHIARVADLEIVNSFYGHGDVILSTECRPNIAGIAFSQNEKRILSVSADGVVIVRNIDL